jgi:methylated-DNA-protein-cysteine methyltransferase-like protein
MADARTQFSTKIIELIQSVPKGKVATYGLIAELAGKPGASRAVGWLLHSSTRKHALPWQRIIKSGGLLSFPVSTANFTRQQRLLQAEGVEIENGKVDLKKYLWARRPRRKSAAEQRR